MLTSRLALMAALCATACKTKTPAPAPAPPAPAVPPKPATDSGLSVARPVPAARDAGRVAVVATPDAGSAAAQQEDASVGTCTLVNRVVTPSVEQPPDPADTSDAVKHACDALVTARKAMIEKTVGAGKVAKAEAALKIPACQSSPKGAWGFDVVEFTAGNMEEYSNAQAEVAPVYIKPDGTLLRFETTYHVGIEVQGAWINVLTAYDWDRDGVSEIVFSPDGTSEGGAEYHGQPEMLTVRNSVVTQFTPLAARIVSVEDVDRDGRPDLIVHGRPHGAFNLGAEPSHYYGPSQLLHTQLDGTLRHDDALAWNYLAAQCPRATVPPTTRLTMAEPKAWMRDLGCALAWGQSPAPWFEHMVMEDPDAETLPISVSEIQADIARPDPIAIRLSCAP